MNCNNKPAKKRIVPFNGSLDEFYHEHLSFYMDRDTFEKAVINSTYHKDPLPIPIYSDSITNAFDRLQLFNNHK